jgi:hypothetical protein
VTVGPSSAGTITYDSVDIQGLDSRLISGVNWANGVISMFRLKFIGGHWPKGCCIVLLFIIIMLLLFYNTAHDLLGYHADRRTARRTSMQQECPVVLPVGGVGKFSLFDSSSFCSVLFYILLFLLYRSVANSWNLCRIDTGEWPSTLPCR